MLTLLSGSSLALTLSYLTQPLLTRLYTPEAFGILDAFVALVSLLFVLGTLRYEDALLLPADDAEARGLLRLAVYVLIGLSMLCLLLSLPARLLLQHRTALADWLPWLAPTLLLMGSGRLAELWLMRRQAFRTLSAGTALRATTTATVRLVAGLPPIQAGATGLIGGFLSGHLSTLLLYSWRLHRTHSILSKPSPPLHALAHRYRHFPLFTLPAALLNALSMRLPFLLLLAFFDAQVLGFFGRAFMVLTVPMGLVGGATGQVFFVRAAEVRRSNALRLLTLRVYHRLLQIGLYPALLLIMMGPELFAFVFGTPWRTAGQYAAWITPWLLLAGLASPLSRLFDVLERQRTDLATSALLFLLQTLALIIGGLYGHPETALLLLGLTGALGRTIQLSVLLHLAGASVADVFAPLFRYLRYSLLLLGLLYLTATWLNPSVYLTLALLSVPFYLGLSTWLERHRAQSVR
ncbi:MAG: oligosaccharide flippase family protein [Rhodothermus sp.]|nr:oligosaccharide flippase family protein [Rhodothermus sp.]